MDEVAHAFARWLAANGLHPADVRLRLEAKTIIAQRDLTRALAAEVDPALAPAAAIRLRPTLHGVEIGVTGPLPHA